MGFNPRSVIMNTTHSPDHSHHLISDALHSLLHLRQSWSRHRTERLLESLPAEIRKDIGWPTADHQQGQE
jgi:hypothetical protein